MPAIATRLTRLPLRCLVIVTALLLCSRGSRAAVLTACTAAEIVAQDRACPSSGDCTIAKDFTVGDGCSLNFGARAVVVSGTLTTGSGAVTLRAQTLTVDVRGVIDGRGSGAAFPDNFGGDIRIETAAGITLQRAGSLRARIDVSGNAAGGSITLLSGGPVAINGKLLASELNPNGGGGTIAVEVGGDITSTTGSVIEATGGTISQGGSITLRTDGSVTLGDEVDVSGGSGGSISIEARRAVTVAQLSANGLGGSVVDSSEGGGGEVEIVAGDAIQLLGAVSVNGDVGQGENSGGDGGRIDIESQWGAVTVAAPLNASGGAPDGSGGDITLDAHGTLTTQAAAMVTADADGVDGSGGDVTVTSGRDVQWAGSANVAGPFGAGEIAITGRADVIVGGTLDASGPTKGSTGGSVTVEAGHAGAGTLTITGSVTVDGGGCGTIDVGCGRAGDTDLSGCAVTIAATATVSARAPSAGENRLTAREQLTVNGSVNAAATTSGGTRGVNVLR